METNFKRGPKKHKQESNAIARARIALGKTQADIAQACGISRTHYLAIENGKATPSAMVLSRLAQVLGVSADYILDNIEITGAPLNSH